jgi:hypothetical protein
MVDDFYEFDQEEQTPKKRDSLFLWTVFILLLIGIAFGCWLGSFYVFGHPEEARNYRILQRVKRIDPVKRFQDTKGPVGDFKSAKSLFDRYSAFPQLQLERENAELLRTFVTNYRETKKEVPYVRGEFTILAARPLTAEDFITSGMVVLAQSNDFPQMLIEHLFPMDADEVRKARPVLAVGNPIKIEKSRDLAAVIHAERAPESRMLFTVVNLLYRPYGVRGSVGTFATEPPADLHIESNLPVLKAGDIDPALKQFTEFRRSQPVPAPGEPGAPPQPPTPQIVGLEGVPDGVKPPETGALPEMPVATPIPVAGGPKTPPKPGVRPPAATPPPIASASPIPMPERGGHIGPSPGTVLKPFIASKPDVSSVPGADGNNWRTYKPGTAPQGRVVSSSEAAAFIENDVPAHTYLRGNFYVTVTGENQAVLRPRGGAESAGAGPVRIIVLYPNGAVPPPEQSDVVRTEKEPFEIRDVRRGRDGILSIWVREIIEQ